MLGASVITNARHQEALLMMRHVRMAWSMPGDRLFVCNLQRRLKFLLPKSQVDSSLPVFKVCHKLHMYEELAGQGSDQGVSPKEDLAVRLEYRM
jgi:hypothetical protein